ncbi:M78 protein [Murid betaherpesvirus 1]|uniref:M78 protein n=1 Tax=Murid herpesvirus 1 TaxID=10366 RepID=H2A2S2_MUHV1|nr:M78 protein [Murid betaherpesvirus 1]
MPTSSCAVDYSYPEVDAEHLSFIQTYNILVTSTFAVVGLISIVLILGSLILSMWRKVWHRRNGGARIYVFNLFLAEFMYVASFVAIWLVRVVCPSKVTEPYCRLAIMVNGMSEGAVSFFYLYLTLDRLCLVGAVTEKKTIFNTSAGKDLVGVIWVTVVAWISAFIVGAPALTSQVMRDRAGFLPVCEMQGPDDMPYVLMHVTAVYVVPFLIIISRLFEMRYSARDGTWHFVSGASIYYVMYMIIVVPIIICRVVISFGEIGHSLSQTTLQYVDLISTAGWQGRGIAVAFACDVVVKYVEAVGEFHASVDGSDDHRSLCADLPSCIYPVGTTLVKSTFGFFLKGAKAMLRLCRRVSPFGIQKDALKSPAAMKALEGAAYDNKSFSPDEDDDDKIPTVCEKTGPPPSLTEIAMTPVVDSQQKMTSLPMSVFYSDGGEKEGVQGDEGGHIIPIPPSDGVTDDVSALLPTSSSVV